MQVPLSPKVPPEFQKRNFVSFKSEKFDRENLKNLDLKFKNTIFKGAKLQKNKANSKFFLILIIKMLTNFLN